MVVQDERRDILNAAGERHNIEVVKVWQRQNGEWFIQLFQEVHPFPDGSGEYVTARWHDLEMMYSDLVQYLECVPEVDVMNIFGTNLFEYLAGEMFLDSNGKPVVFKMTVKDVNIRKIANGRGGDEEKPVVSFNERPKLLVLNKTNARAIAGMYGGETDDWIGKQIALTGEHGAWFGKKGVRVVVLDHLPANGNGKPKAKAKSKKKSLADGITLPPPPMDEEEVPWTDGV